MSAGWYQWSCGQRFGSATCWDCGLNSRQAHGRLPLVSVVCCQVEVSVTSWSFIQWSPTECGVSECDRKASIMRRPWLTKGCCAMKKCVVDWYRKQLQDTPTWECLGTWQSVHSITSTGLFMTGIIEHWLLRQICMFKFSVPNYIIFTGIIKHHQLLWSDIPRLVPWRHTASLGLLPWTQADSSSTKSAPWSILRCDRGTAYVICIMNWNNSRKDQPQIYQFQD